MPKTYTEEQKADIIRRLKKEANDCLMKYGVRKTTVDELVQRVHIPKGTFYLFYKSKELLIFDVILELHQQIEDSMLAEAGKLAEAGNMELDKLTDLICYYLNFVTNTCLSSIMRPEEMALLLKKLPQEVVMEHLAHDDDDVMKIISMLPGSGNANIEAVSGAFRAIFFAYQYQREIGEKHFEESMRLLITGLLRPLM